MKYAIEILKIEKERLEKFNCFPNMQLAKAAENKINQLNDSILTIEYQIAYQE